MDWVHPWIGLDWIGAANITHFHSGLFQTQAAATVRSTIIYRRRSRKRQLAYYSTSVVVKFHEYFRPEIFRELFRKKIVTTFFGVSRVSIFSQ